MQITLQTKVLDALKMSKEVKKIFNKYELSCPECKGISQDTIQKVIINNGLDSKKFLNDLNGAL